MTHTELTTVLILAAIAVNVPFGAYRAMVTRFSWRWFLAIHAPIPFVIMLRVALGLSLWSVPLVLAASIAGQLLGSWLLALRRERRFAEVKAD